MNNESLIVKPESLLVVSPSMTMNEVQRSGGFQVGELIPLKGFSFRVVKIVSNEHGDFRLALQPVRLTKRYEKQLAGKTGKKNAKRAKRAKAR